MTIATLGGCGGADDTRTPTPPPISTSGTGVPAAATTAPTSIPSIRAVVGAVVWTTAVDPNTNAPTASVDAFTVDTLTLYAVVPVRNLLPNAVLTTDWTYNDTSLDALATRTISPAGLDDGWVEFHLTRAEGEEWPDGTYAISIRLNGDLVQTAEVPVERG